MCLSCVVYGGAGFDALDTTVCVLDTLGCALDVGGGGKGCVFASLPFCHVLFLCGLHCFSEGFAPWLRRVGRVADGSAVLVGVFGLVVWRDFWSLSGCLETCVEPRCVWVKVLRSGRHGFVGLS